MSQTTDVQLHTEHTSQLGIDPEFESRTLHDYFVLLVHEFLFSGPSCYLIVQSIFLINE